MSIQDTIDAFQANIKAKIEALPFLRADKLGLDRRAGSVYVDAENRAIYCPSGNLRAWDYYGGMEYVKEHAGPSAYRRMMRRRARLQIAGRIIAGAAFVFLLALCFAPMYF